MLSKRRVFNALLKCYLYSEYIKFFLFAGYCWAIGLNELTHLSENEIATARGYSSLCAVINRNEWGRSIVAPGLPWGSGGRMSRVPSAASFVE